MLHERLIEICYAVVPEHVHRGWDLMRQGRFNFNLVDMTKAAAYYGFINNVQSEEAEELRQELKHFNETGIWSFSE